MRQHTANASSGGILPNPIAINLATGGSITPHAKTIRDTYTVPVGKSARIVSGNLRQLTLTPGSVPGSITSTMDFNLGGAGLVTVAQIEIIGLFGGAAGNYDITGPYDLSAGDIINLTTADLSTGGTVYYSSSVFIIEYG